MRLQLQDVILFSLPDDTLVAIDKENQKVLDHCLSIWKNLKDVPVDRTVRGVFVKKVGGDIVGLGNTPQQNEITINQLRPVD